MSIVTDHVLELLEPIDDRLKVKPRLDISDREYQLFWRYHGHYPAEFAAALAKSLPEGHTFVSYDHLKNQLITDQLQRMRKQSYQ